MKLEGIWKIVYAEPEKNHHRLNRLVTFPLALKSGQRAVWHYVESNVGGTCVTSLVLSFTITANTLTIRTENSVYKFEKEDA